MVGDILRHLIADAIILVIGLILGYIASFALLIAVGFEWAGSSSSRPPDPDADDGDDRRLHLHSSPGLCLKYHGRARDDVGLAQGFRRGESGVADDQRQSRPDGGQCDALAMSCWHWPSQPRSRSSWHPL